MNKVILLLGGNIGDRSKYIGDSISDISKLGNISARSSIYESEAWGFESENNFLNQAIELETIIGALDLLKELQKIENNLGRKRHGNVYTSRKIDIDILFYNTEIITTQDLIIPHPRMHKRLFTLKCVMDIIPNYVHPVLKMSIIELEKECNDTVKVWKYIND